MNNAVFGWWWIAAGFAWGAVMGIRFQRTDWLGGYGSFPRRMLRLGHIAMIMLGLLNVVFAWGAAEGYIASASQPLASWLLIAGAVTMPVCCVLMAWRNRLQPLFVIPVTSLIAAAVILAAGSGAR